MYLILNTSKISYLLNYYYISSLSLFTKAKSKMKEFKQTAVNICYASGAGILVEMVRYSDAGVAPAQSRCLGAFLARYAKLSRCVLNNPHDSSYVPSKSQAPITIIAPVPTASHRKNLSLSQRNHASFTASIRGGGSS
jgi:hypothetical protein